MHERPAHPWTIVELAKEAALSRSTFFERFSRAVGLAPMEYLLTWRMALAKDLLRRNEGRIAELKHLHETARMGEAAENDGAVHPGTVVTAVVAGDEMTFLFGNREIAADDESLEVYSERSPLGEAINGAKKGDKVSYTAPNGKDIKVEVKDVQPYSG